MILSGKSSSEWLGRWGSALPIWALAFMLWSLTRPYAGMWHDTIVYSLIAAHDLNPTAFARDAFFAFGSQGEWSIYGPFFVRLVAWLGLDAANHLVQISGGVLWCASLVALGWAIWGDGLPMRFLALFGATFAAVYSPNLNTFTINEHFPTARVLAMPLGVFALAAEVAGKRGVALACAMLSSLLHPLLGIWALLTVTACRWPARWLLASLSAVLLVLVLGACLEAGPLRVMAPAWAETVRYPLRDVFLGDPEYLALSRLALPLLALCLSARLGAPRLRPVSALLALMLAWAYLIALVCSYFYPVQLVMQVQLWRVMWLAMVLGIAGAIDVAWRRVNEGKVECLEVVFLGLVCFALPDLALWFCGAYAAYLLVFSGYPVCVQGRIWVGRHLRSAWGLAIVLSMFLLPSYSLELDMLGAGVFRREEPLGDALLGFFVAGGVGLGFLCLAFALRSRALRCLVLVVFAFFLVRLDAFWDQRPASTRAIEARYLSQPPSSRPFGELIRSGEVVFWPGGEFDTWFVLHTPFYASSYQAIGIVFSHEKTSLMQQRLERLAIAEMLGEYDLSLGEERLLEKYRANLLLEDKDLRDLKNYRLTTLTPAAVAYLCRDSALDWVVAPVRKENESYPGSVPGRYLGQNYRITRCRDI